MLYLFFHLLSQPFELLMHIESSPRLFEIIRPSSWSSSQLTGILHWPLRNFRGFPFFFPQQLFPFSQYRTLWLQSGKQTFLQTFRRTFSQGIFLLQGNKVSSWDKFRLAPLLLVLVACFAAVLLLWENKVHCLDERSWSETGVWWCILHNSYRWP